MRNTFGVIKMAIRAMTLFVLVALPLMASRAQADVSIEYVRPGMDLNKYSEFMVSPLDLSDQNVVPPPWAENNKPHKWVISEKNISYMRSVYLESISAGLSESGKYKVVEQASANAMLVDIKIVRLTPWAKHGDKSGVTQGSGEIKFEVRLRDAHTGDLLALAEGVQNIGKNVQENTRLNHEHNLKEHFHQWGSTLSNALTKNQASK